ncbi:PilN domain-containing protein [Rugamonas sp. A1-17]|nr:PilN domain-containing protein [Rugamonas sp. A1-17]
MNDFSHFLKPAPRFGRLFAIATLAATGLGAWVWRDVMILRAAQVKVQQQSEALRLASVPAPVAARNRAELDEQKRWAALQDERAFAWPPLFAALEQAGNADIELLEFQPDKTSQRLVLRGEAKDEAALSDFLEALSSQPILRNVYLSRRKLKQRDRLVTVFFEIKASMANSAKPGAR